MRCPNCKGAVSITHDETDCPICGWDSAPTCDHCGERATGKDYLTGQPVCDEHGPREDGPMGGMGHEISYDCSHTYNGGDADR